MTTNKYQRTVKGVSIDVYDVLKAWNVTNPAVQHAIKKLLQPGQRGVKSVAQDLCEAKQSIERAIELEGTTTAAVEQPSDEKPSLYVYGPPGSGKTTLTRSLMEYFGLNEALDNYYAGTPLENGIFIRPTGMLILGVDEEGPRGMRKMHLTDALSRMSRGEKL